MGMIEKEPTKRIVVVNVNLQFDLPDNIKSHSALEEFLMEVELPTNYIEGSAEYVKTLSRDNLEDVDF